MGTGTQQGSGLGSLLSRPCNLRTGGVLSIALGIVETVMEKPS